MGKDGIYLQDVTKLREGGCLSDLVIRLEYFKDDLAPPQKIIGTLPINISYVKNSTFKCLVISVICVGQCKGNQLKKYDSL